jgi:Lrp/AsnC family transcriptional regulator
MKYNLDEYDRKILRVLQKDASISMDALAERVALSRNACWRRVKLMEEGGIIKGRVTLIDAESVNLGLGVLVLVRTSSHDEGWLENFEITLRDMKEITGAYRMSGDLDYVLRVQVADVKEYDLFYKRLIKKVPIADISASFMMENIKDTTELPL